MISSNSKTSGSVQHTGRKKSNSLRESINLQRQEKKDNGFSVLGYLDCPLDLKAAVQKRLGTDGLVDYIQDALNGIYLADPLDYRGKVKDYLKAKLPELRPKIQQRLSLLKYLAESLRYRQLSEIDAEIQKEWRKNALLYALNGIWSRSLLLMDFNSPLDIVELYHKQRSFIANVSHHYFKNALSVLDEKKVNTFSHLYEDTSHAVLQVLKDWPGIHGKLLLLLRGKKGSEGVEPNLELDIKSLFINPRYLDPCEPDNQLSDTTRLISLFASEPKIHSQIQLLRQIRAAFLKEIEESRQKLSRKQIRQGGAVLEKDDILGCMIYCIVRGQIGELHLSVKALSLLLGKESELLAKKGVDSFRADLESAVQYLCEEQLNSPLISLPEKPKLSKP